LDPQRAMIDTDDLFQIDPSPNDSFGPATANDPTSRHNTRESINEQTGPVGGRTRPAG
jgi:hypothetical protein